MTPKTTPKDFFLHLGATVALYVGAIALINLAFTTINSVFPDALNYYFSPNSIVWPISVTIVVVPLLYVLEWAIARDLRLMPEKREIWIRRWRIYLTLFLTGATIVGDLIALLNTYLNGEITARFIYKVLVVLIVSAVIFAYYLLARSESKKTAQTGLAWLGLVLGVIAIVGGFLIVGSPANRRAIRFDEQRVGHLQNIQHQILNYWQTTGRIPENLDTLNDSISGVNIPKDPETGQAYKYQKTGNNSFELCATFAKPSSATSNNSFARPIMLDEFNNNWKHETGETCFKRNIDPERYPVNSQIKRL